MSQIRKMNYLKLEGFNQTSKKVYMIFNHSKNLIKKIVEYEKSIKSRSCALNSRTTLTKALIQKEKFK